MRYWLRSVPATTSTVGFRKSAGKSIATLESVSWVPLGVIVAIVGVVVAALAWWFPRNRKGNVSIELTVSIHQLTVINLPRVNKSPIIHSVNGIPTLQHLTQGIEMDAERRGLAQAMYGMGLEQFNHYANNRDGVMAEACEKMDALRNQLSDAELSLADEVGLGLAAEVDDELPEVQSQYNALSLQAREYAMSKRDEHQALRSIARDRETDVPRTDYTSVKARIAAGDVSLESIMGELPIMWQDLRTINERVDPVKPSGKPPRQEFFPVMFFTRDKGVLVDKKAERDGKWLISHKHRMTVPYQEPVPKYEFERADAPPVFTGKRTIIINQDPGTEWQTELWRKGGYLDQRYLRSKAGQEPEQLRKAYRNRQIRRIAWGINAILFAIILIMFFEQYNQ